MSVSLSQFRLMRIVGRGAFGKVRIVEHYETRQLYALKYISKEECIKMDAVRNILRERAILEQLDHPFLCRLRFAFQDNDYMYMVTDLMLGGDLHYHISKQQFNEDVLRFWFAELATAVKYLHCNNVVHRDIKPQNILLDNMGHVHITDFNIATYLHHKRVLTSNSGTGYYMAPEIYKGGGYNEAVDWWSLGITLYECVYGKRPFENLSSEELKTAIRRGCIPYPDTKSVSGECLSVMQGFLELDPSRRLGQGDAGWAALVRHPFFRTIDWRRLEAKEIKPPFQPPTEKNNFDLTYDLEELILGDNSHVQARRASKASRAIEQNAKRQRDLQLIQEKFIQFDHTVFEKYEGFKDPVRMTVGDPPDWVKPAFEGAEQGNLLPVKRITTMSMADWQQDDGSLGSTVAQSPMIPAHHGVPKDAAVRNRSLESPGIWRGPNRSASTSNLAAKAEQDAQITPWKRLSLGTVQAKRASGESQLAGEASPGSLSEEYAMSLHGLRKKQSTRNFLERRERDRKSIHQHDTNTTNEARLVSR